MARRLWRHHPADAGARWQWPAVVGPDISLAPSAGSAPTPALYVSNSLGGLEAINQQGRFIVTRPIAIALAATIDEEVANAVRSNRLYRDGLRVHRSIDPKPNEMARNGKGEKPLRAKLDHHCKRVFRMNYFSASQQYFCWTLGQ